MEKVCKPGGVNPSGLVLSYSEELLKKIRQIKGRRWDPEKKYWTIPNNDLPIIKFKESDSKLI
jgi:hypothetical protein